MFSISEYPAQFTSEQNMSFRFVSFTKEVFLINEAAVLVNPKKAVKLGIKSIKRYLFHFLF